MRFSWTGLILAPLIQAAFLGLRRLERAPGMTLAARRPLPYRGCSHASVDVNRQGRSASTRRPVFGRGAATRS
jgi:hypothetical protein